MKRKTVLFAIVFLFVQQVGCGRNDEEMQKAEKAAAEALEAAKMMQRQVEESNVPAAKEKSGLDLTKYPANEEGAKQLLSEFLKADSDKLALTAALKPRPEDYNAVFANEEMSKKAQSYYEEMWKMMGSQPISPKAGQSSLLLVSATTDELKAGTGKSSEFPGGYKDAAANLKPGLTVYKWKFVKPGETLGMAFDGLYNVNGRWAIMPKPWRIK
jgi:hypothetical protein